MSVRGDRYQKALDFGGKELGTLHKEMGTLLKEMYILQMKEKRI